MSLEETALAAAPEVSTSAPETSDISTGTDGGVQTDESILGIDTETLDQPIETTETPTETPTVDAEIVDDYAWTKVLLKDRNIAPKLQSLIDREKAYQSTGLTVADARSLAEKLPGGIAEIDRLVTKSQEADEMDLAYTSGDPEIQSQAVQGMYELDPASFQSSLDVAFNILQKNDSNAYAEKRSQLLNRFVNEESGGKFGEHLGAMEQAIANGNFEQLTTLAKNLITWSKEKGLNGEKPTQLDPRADQFKQQDAARNQQKSQAFQQTTNKSVTASVQSGIDKIPFPATFNPQAQGRIKAEILQKVSDALVSDRMLSLEYAKGLKGSMWLEGTGKVIEAYSAKAKQILPGIAKTVIEDWTKTVLGASATRQTRQAAAASRTDVRGGSSDMRAPSKAVRPSQVDYRNSSDDDILSDRVALRK